MPMTNGPGDTERQGPSIAPSPGPYVLRRKSNQEFLVRTTQGDKHVVCEIKSRDWKYPAWKLCQANAQLFAASWDLLQLAIHTVERIADNTAGEPVGFLLRDLYDEADAILLKLDMTSPPLNSPPQALALNMVAIPMPLLIDTAPDVEPFFAWHKERGEWIQVVRLENADMLGDSAPVLHRATNTWFYAQYWCPAAPQPPDEAPITDPDALTDENPE